MRFTEDLSKEYDRIQRLKANIHTKELLRIVELEKRIWIPKTKVIEGPVYHGSKAGDVEPHTLYWDEYNREWTVKSFAFKGHLFKLVSDLLFKNKIQ